MGEYSKYISEKRRSVPTPKDMVTDGKSVFGTFDKEFETMDMIHIKNPTASKEKLNYLKFTCWEAAVRWRSVPFPVPPRPRATKTSAPPSPMPSS